MGHAYGVLRQWSWVELRTVDWLSRVRFTLGYSYASTGACGGRWGEEESGAENKQAGDSRHLPVGLLEGVCGLQ